LACSNLKTGRGVLMMKQQRGKGEVLETNEKRPSITENLWPGTRQKEGKTSKASLGSRDMLPAGDGVKAPLLEGKVTQPAPARPT